MDDDYLEITAGDVYRKTAQSNGVRTTFSLHGFEIVCQPTGEVDVKAAMRSLKEWISYRRKRVDC